MHQSVKMKLVVRSVHRLEPGDYREALASSPLWAEQELPQASFFAERGHSQPRGAVMRRTPQ